MRKPNARERILETASRLFFKRGYSEVGINEIIEKAETAKASFYQHYPSKEALCEAWLSHVHDKSEVSRSEILEMERPASEKLELYFDQLETFMKQSEFRGCPYSNTGAVSDESCSGILEQIQGHKESIRRFFREICFQHCGDREKADRDGDRLFVLYSGATTECQNMKDLWPVHSARAAALELLHH
jgi:AcrR family transcriptional regulator